MRSPLEYASSKSARSRTPISDASSIMTRRTASSGDSVCGSVCGALGARTPEHGLAAISFLRASHSKKPRQLDRTRASERGDCPLPCSVATKRRMSFAVSAAGSRPAESDASSAPSRAYASSVFAANRRAVRRCVR
jgi:hypothetical protein